MEAITYDSSTTYDALNRPVTLTAPDKSILHHLYNAANLLEGVEVNLRGAAAATPFVSNIDYNPKGQRELIQYQNGAQTKYDYDDDTFRLIHLKTTRLPGPNGLGLLLFADPTIVQDLHYAYDPAGNITTIRDDALLAIQYNGQDVKPRADFTYDAIYRLIFATGREHIGQTAFECAPADGNCRDYPFVGLRANPNDPKALRNYTEGYDYDEVGNILHMRHVATAGAWTRDYTYQEASLLEATKLSNCLSSTAGNGTPEACASGYGYDAHGNMTKMRHLPVMHWDFRDQLLATAQQVVNAGTPETTWYVYDGGGQRVRKVTDNAAVAGATPTRKTERIYVGGFEIYREYNGAPNPIKLERETLQVMDDKQRIALVDTRTKGNEPELPPQLIRYVLSNHLGSSSLELADDGALISYEEYHPYGTSAFQASRSVVEVGLKRYRYTGKERDDETALYYHGARYYAPWLGLWIAVDPKHVAGSPVANVALVAEGRPRREDPWRAQEEPWSPRRGRRGESGVPSVSGAHMYAYANGNPANYIDPDGAEPTREKVGEAKNIIRHVRQLEAKYTAELKGQLSGLELEQAVNKRILEKEFREYKTFDKPGERYIYTTRGGWIDMAHFPRAAGEISMRWWRNVPVVGALGQLFAEKKGREVEEGQLVSPNAGVRHSAFSYEDLPSNRLGFEFGSNVDLSRPLSKQLEADFARLGATRPKEAPNWKTLPKRDVDTLSRTPPQNFSDEPMFTKERWRMELPKGPWW